MIKNPDYYKLRLAQVTKREMRGGGSKNEPIHLSMEEEALNLHDRKLISFLQPTFPDWKIVYIHPSAFFIYI